MTRNRQEYTVVIEGQEGKRVKAYSPTGAIFAIGAYATHVPRLVGNGVHMTRGRYEGELATIYIYRLTPIDILAV